MDGWTKIIYSRRMDVSSGADHTGSLFSVQHTSHLDIFFYSFPITGCSFSGSVILGGITQFFTVTVFTDILISQFSLQACSPNHDCETFSESRTHSIDVYA